MMGEISVADRDTLWKNYNKFSARASRALAGTLHAAWHWIAKWWKLNPAIGALQVLYVSALFVGGWVTIHGTIASVPARPTTAPATAIDSVDEWVTRWSKQIVASCGVVVLIYKTKAAHAVAPHEMERRKSISHLMRRLDQSKAVDCTKLEGSTEARLNEICECIRRDAEEFLEIRESDVSVLLLRYDQAEREHGGRLTAIARDRPCDKGFFVAGWRTAMDTFVYEAIRKSQTITFHDLQASIVTRCYGEIKAEYRSVFCLPVARSHESRPYGILTLQLRYPYMLWPKNTPKLERRLSMYVEVINLFYPREAIA